MSMIRLFGAILLWVVINNRKHSLEKLNIENYLTKFIENKDFMIIIMIFSKIESYHDQAKTKKGGKYISL